MRYLTHKRERFYDILDNYSQIYSFTNEREQLVYSAGVLNFIWNQWNNFWRDFWIAHISGGVDFNGNKIIPIYSNYTDKQSCHYLLHACGKRTKHIQGDSINGVYQEIAWGAPDNISKIALKLSHHHSYMNYLLGILTHYTTTLQHFQKIRNSLVHLNNENVHILNSLTGYYIFSPNQRLLDILETTSIGSSTRCFDNLINNMGGMLKNL